jgi:fatty acid desaturase
VDHRSLIKSLSPEQRSRLTRRSDLKGLAQLALHVGAILGVGCLILLRVPFWPILLLVQGVLIIFLFTALHETIHRTVFKTQWMNVAAARFCAFLIALPPDWFRYFHFAHHRFTQDPEKDPELAAPKPETLGQYLATVSGLPVWWSHGKTLLRNALGRCDDAFVPASGRAKVQREAIAMIAAYGLVLALSLASGSTALLFIWVLPVILGQPFLRLYLMAEHGRCPYVANMLENSRTTFTNWLVLKLTWNMPYHAEHHVFPAVPFHQLPAFHDLTRPHLRVTEKGYNRFHRKYLAALTN